MSFDSGTVENKGEVQSLTAKEYAILHKLAENRGKIVTMDIPDDLHNITIPANEELFKRMLENLINNSIRHNSDGCEIGIKLTTDRNKSNRCILQISDNGQGTSAEVLKDLNRMPINKAGTWTDSLEATTKAV